MNVPASLRLAIHLAALVPVACEDRLIQGRVQRLAHDAGCDSTTAPTADAGRPPPPPPECKGACCPTATECYPLGNPSVGSGAECLAGRDNTGQRRWQLRQVLSVSTTPPGIAEANIATLLARRSELRSDACRAPAGLGGFMQLIDFDRDTDTSRVGFARHAGDAQTATREGLCFVEGTYDSPAEHLATPYTPTEWPMGLPLPLALPFRLHVVTAYRWRTVDGDYTDFHLETDREEILRRLDPETGDLGAYTGIFHLDEATGVMHGYAPLTFILNYDSADAYDAIPIRESEIRMQLNDPEHPNCAGAFLGDNPELDESCTGNSTSRAWGCVPGSCASTEAGPTAVHGYFLLSELEQVRNGLLGKTLCDVMAGSKGYDGWTLDRSCRSDAKWNPADPVRGLPPGDWCAATNGPATATCHDALRSVSTATFQAFPIQEATCAPR